MAEYINKEQQINDPTRGDAKLKGIPSTGQQQQQAQKEKEVSLKDITSHDPIADYNDWYYNNEFIEYQKALQYSHYDNLQDPYQEVKAPSDFGKSKYDKEIENYWQLNDINEVRAQNQSAVAQIGSGIGKFFTTASSTFLEGTLGTVWGVGAAINSAIEGDSAAVAWSKLWDNDVSKALHQFNQWTEELMPNYRTYEQQNAAWYDPTNLISANGVADMIKMAGFTVGAYYGGGVWTKALKGAGLLKHALAARVVGSTVGALGEASIEAINNMTDVANLGREQLIDATTRALSEQGMDDIDAETLIDTITPEKAEQLKQQLDADLEQYVPQTSKEGYDPLAGANEALFRNLQKENERKKALIDSILQQKQDLRERIAQQGNIQYAANVAIVSAADLVAYGNLYARGFNGARKQMFKNGAKKTVADAADELLKQKEDELAKSVVRDKAGHWIAKTTSTGKAIGRSVGKGLAEGLEEMNQSVAATVAGKGVLSDDPDAFYRSLTDPDYQYKTANFLTNVGSSICNTYGNFDNYQEGFAAFIQTALFGIPTFGKVSNSGAETYLGRGKFIGMTGGIFGEIANTRDINERIEQSVRTMNAFEQKAKTASEFVNSMTAMSDAMDGYVEADDKFNYLNSRDNQMFAAIAAYGRMGKLADLKEIINQDFENFTDEELMQIAGYTSSSQKQGDTEVTGWRNVDGSFLPATEEGAQKMREKLTEKRDEILKQVDQYEKDVEWARMIVSDAAERSEQDTNEIAWLKWKTDQFVDRFGSLTKERKENFRQLYEDIKTINTDAFSDNEKGKILLNNVEFLNKLLEVVNKVANKDNERQAILSLASLIKNNKKAIDSFFDLAQNENFSFYDFCERQSFNTMDLQELFKEAKDLVTIATAYQSFSDRLEEYIKDPLQQKKNHEKIQNQQRQQQQKNVAQELLDKVNNGENLIDEDLSKIFENFENEEDLEELLKAVDKKDQDAAKSLLEQIKELSNKFTYAKYLAEGLDKLSLSNVKVAEILKDYIDNYSEDVLINVFFDDTNFNLNNLIEQYIQDHLLNEDDAQQLRKNVIAALHDLKDYVDSQMEKPDVPTNEQGGEQPVENNDKETEGADPVGETPAVGNINGEKAVEVFPEIINAIYDLLPTEGKSEKEQEEIRTAISNGLKTKHNSDIVLFSSSVAQVCGCDVNIALNAINSGLALNSNNPVEVHHNEPNSSTREIQEADLTGLKNISYWKPNFTAFGINERPSASSKPYQWFKSTAYDNKTSQALAKYFIEHHVFEYTTRNYLQAGDEIFIVVDNSLNKEIDPDGNTIVLLLQTKDGKIVGNLPIKGKDANYNSSLDSIYNFIEKHINKDADTIQDFGLKTHISKWMVGRPYFYGKEGYVTLTEAQQRDAKQSESENENGNKNVRRIKLGVTRNAGSQQAVYTAGSVYQKATDGRGDGSVMHPLDSYAGQVFLLVDTGTSSSNTRRYIPYPTYTATYEGEENDFTKILTSHIDKFKAAIDTAIQQHGASEAITLKSILDLKDALQSTFCGRFSINVFDRGNIKILYETIDESGNKKMEILYKGDYQSFSKDNFAGKALLPNADVNKINTDITVNGVSTPYNEVISPYIITNTSLHTVNNWFTINPLSINDKGDLIETEAESPASIKSSTPQFAVNYKNGERGNEGKANPITPTPKPKEKDSERLGEDLTKEEKEKRIEKNYKTLTRGRSDSNKAFKAKLEKLYKINKADFDAILLDPNFDVKKEQIKAALMQQFNNGVFNKELFDKQMNHTLFRKQTIENYRKIDLNKETSWLSEVLPQVTKEDKLVIVKSLIKINKSEYAYGQVSNGVMTIAETAAEGTVYHEAFHIVTQSILTEEELDKLYSAAEKYYNTSNLEDLEEKLAEDFRRYVQLETTPVIGKIVKFFRKIIHTSKIWKKHESYIKSVYYSIARGEYAQRTLHSSDTTFNHNADPMTVSGMQSIVDSNVNNPRLNPKGTKVELNTIWGQFKKRQKTYGREITGYYDEQQKKYIVVSVKPVSITRHRIAKVDFNNLNKEQLETLTRTNISEEMYNKMSLLEKEQLLACN